MRGRSPIANITVSVILTFLDLHLRSLRTSQSMVKKKAALTLLRLYRKHPEVIPAAEWALRIVAIMDDRDLVRTLIITSGTTRAHML